MTNLDILEDREVDLWSLVVTWIPLMRSASMDYLDRMLEARMASGQQLHLLLFIFKKQVMDLKERKTSSVGQSISKSVEKSSVLWFRVEKCNIFPSDVVCMLG